MGRLDPLAPTALVRRLQLACSGDIDRIASETGYHAAFATVIYRGAPLPCRNPGGRGVFGNAVLTKAPITASEDQAFEAQLGRRSGAGSA